MDVAELYGLPPDRFVPERDALARELRAAGRRDEAGAVAALRKPSVAAHAVNRLAREHRPRLRELFTAGDALTEVQSDVLAGRAGGRALGEAAERERAAVSGLVDAARAMLAAEGLTASSSMLERIGETLHAAALDDEARGPVDEGRLERELRHVGLGMGAGGELVAPAKGKPAKAAPAREPAKTRARDAKADDRAKAEERARAEERAKALKQAQTAETEARRQATRTAKALDGAERARSRAAEALDRAERALTEARAEAKAAEQAHRKAERQLRRLEP